MGRVGASHASASSLVARSATTTTAAVPQNTRRSATLAIFLLGLALDAEPGVRQRVEPLEHDVLAALLALAELLGRLIQPPQGLVDVPEIAALLRGEQERFLTLHGVGALVRHVERVAREVAVRRLQTRVEGLVVIAELLHHPGALLEQSLLEMGQLLLVQATLGRLGLGFRRHYRVPPFRPSWRRSAIVTRRASMSISRVTSASSSTVPSTSLRASVSPSTNPWNADTAATISAAPATLSSMRVVYSYPASLRRRWTRFTSSRARPSWIRSSVNRGSTAAT